VTCPAAVELVKLVRFVRLVELKGESRMALTAGGPQLKPRSGGDILSAGRSLPR
jgi:hypothetical protein